MHLGQKNAIARALGNLQMLMRVTTDTDPLAVLGFTDDQVTRMMDGHAMWDDPPDDWTKQDLIKWSRGYLYGRAIEAINTRENARLAIMILEAA